jgi:hypothetical protein
MSVRRADLHLACGLRNDRPVSVNGAGIRECHCGPGIFNRPDTTTAPCVPSTTDPNISVCDCVVVNGYSIGFKSCTDRAQLGTKVWSTFSTVNVKP